MCDSPGFFPAPALSQDGASKTPFLKYDDLLMARAESGINSVASDSGAV